MAWCKLEDTVTGHHKFNKLAEILRIRRAEARGLFLCLCAWAVANAPDGNLEDFSDDDIERAADWEGRKGRMVEAMTHCSLLYLIPMTQRSNLYVNSSGKEIKNFLKRNLSFGLVSRKRKQRESLKNVTRQECDMSRKSHAGEREGEREYKESTKEKPKTHTQELFDPYEETSKKTKELELELERIYLSSKPNSLLTRLSPNDRKLISELVASVSDPILVLNNFLRDGRAFYAERGWPLQSLIRDIAQHSEIERPPEKLNFYVPPPCELSEEQLASGRAEGARIRAFWDAKTAEDKRIEEQKKLDAAKASQERSKKAHERAEYVESLRARYLEEKSLGKKVS